MSTDGAVLGRLFNSIMLTVAVPVVVVTCQARTLPYPEGSVGGGAGESDSNGAGGATAQSTWTALGTGGAISTSTPVMTSAGGAYPTSNPATTGVGGSYPTTTATTVVPQFPDAGRTFLGKYVEPAQTAGVYYVPAPPATATVTRPCEEREEMCNGAQSRADWANSVIAQCVAETQSAGCVDFIFELGKSCAKHVVYWNGASLDLGRCVAAVDYYETCSGPDEGPYVTVVRGGPTCGR